MTTPQECIEKAKWYKEEGNRLYKEKNLEAALKHYSHIPLYLNHLQARGEARQYAVFQPTEQEDQVIRELCAQGHANAALCWMEKQDHKKALTQLDLSLTANPTYVKALYRRGKLLLQEKQVDQAEKDIAEACKHAPGDPLVRQLRRELETLQKIQKEKQKKDLSGLFDKLEKSNSK